MGVSTGFSKMALAHPKGHHSVASILTYNERQKCCISKLARCLSLRLASRRCSYAVAPWNGSTTGKDWQATRGRKEGLKGPLVGSA